MKGKFATNVSFATVRLINHLSLPSHTFSLPSQKMFFVYYICNYTTYVTLNDVVVAHL
jgi:hypothetical protein